MFPGMDPRAMQQAMKKMGIKQEEIPASEVIIRGEGKDIIISNPQVVKINMAGADSFQITGNVEERTAEIAINADDVQAVVDQTGVSEGQAREAIQAHDGDLAETILKLKE